MEKKLLDAATAHKYHGARVTDNYAEGKSYKMVGISEYEGNLQVETGNDTDWWNIDQCRLILAPLDAITDEDCLELAIIMGYDKAIKALYNGGQILATPDRLANVHYQIDIDKLSLSAYDFLRSSTHKGKPKQAYDVDGLIEAGVAIDFRTLKTEGI